MEDPVISTKISSAISTASGLDMELPDDVGELVPVPVTTTEVQVMTKDFKHVTQNNLEQDYDFAVTNNTIFVGSSEDLASIVQERLIQTFEND